MGARAIKANYVNAYSPRATCKTGAVLRDDKGRFVVGGNWRIDWCDDVLTAEDLALKFGLFLAQKAGCNRLVVNPDNMEVIDTMKTGGHSAGAAATAFDDCYFLACDFSIIRFDHCNREANQVAHEIARLAKFSAMRDWFEEPMNDIVPFLTDDVTIISN
jgi:hypothetical protein